MKIKIDLNQISDNCFFKGKMFKNGILLSEDDIISLFMNINSKDEILELLTDISGFFYLVLETEKRFFLITDIVRSYPVFYKITDNFIRIHENANDLRTNENFSISDIDGALMCGYVIGNKTIFHNIFQVEAAYLVSISKNEGKIDATPYFNLPVSSYNDKNKKELFFELNEIYFKIVKRLLDYTQGRTIVIPLSAGYDSRLLVMILSQLGVKNVICYSYGTVRGYDINQWEISISKKIAKLLGYRWFCIPYTYRKWNELFCSQETKDYIEYVSRGVSLISYQDWLAVSEIKKKSLVPEDSVFVPGHSGDFIAGSHIPLDYECVNIYQNTDILNANAKNHFNLFSIPKKEQMEICESFFNLDKVSYCGKNYLNNLEIFNWRERQSKYICNSARVYEFYGYDWYFPLWDREIVEFWYSIHPKERKGRKLYYEFIEEYFKSSIPYKPGKSSIIRVANKICRTLNLEPLFNNNWGLYSSNRISLCFKDIYVPNFLNDSVVLANCSKKKKKASINGLGVLYMLTYLEQKDLKKDYKL